MKDRNEQPGLDRKQQALGVTNVSPAGGLKWCEEKVSGDLKKKKKPNLKSSALPCGINMCIGQSVGGGNGTGHRGDVRELLMTLLQELRMNEAEGGGLSQ